MKENSKTNQRMDNKKFIKFLHTFDMDDSLLEAILNGYSALFLEAVNGVARATPSDTPFNDSSPFVNPIRPLGDDIFGKDKFVSDDKGGLTGSGGDGAATPSQTYRYGAALPGSTRDIGEETRQDSGDWSKSLPSLPAIKPRSAKPVTKLMDRAKEHIPTVSNGNSKEGMGVNSNFELNYLGISSENNTPPFQA